jgi:hypothetical protein
MRKSYIFCVLLAFFCVCVTGRAFAVEGYPGSTWGELSWEIPKKGGEQNLLLEGWVAQGITWKKWGNISLSTYGTIRYKWDTEKLDWNNKFSPGIGTALEILSFKQFHIRVGAEYLWERFYESGHEEQKVWIYTDWYGWWNFKK